MAKFVIEDAPKPLLSFDKMTPEEQREDLNRQVLEARAQAVKEPPKPMPLSNRMREKIEAEMARGAEVLKKNAENQAAQRAYKADPTEGQNKPVFRPADFVPSMNQGKSVSASVKSTGL